MPPIFTKEERQTLHETKSHVLNTVSHTFPAGPKSPVDHISSRIKTEPSIRGKFKRKHPYEKLTPETVLDSMDDIIGIRIVTHSISETYSVLNTIQSGFSIKETIDYIMDPKPTGYRGIHVILNVHPKKPAGIFENISALPLEIQIRTLAMDCFASVEHRMVYKNPYPVPDAIRTELLRCSNELFHVDLSMDALQAMMTKNLNKKS